MVFGFTSRFLLVDTHDCAKKMARYPVMVLCVTLVLIICVALYSFVPFACATTKNLTPRQAWAPLDSVASPPASDGETCNNVPIVYPSWPSGFQPNVSAVFLIGKWTLIRCDVCAPVATECVVKPRFSDLKMMRAQRLNLSFPYLRRLLLGARSYHGICAATSIVRHGMPLITPLHSCAVPRGFNIMIT